MKNKYILGNTNPVSFAQLEKKSTVSKKGKQFKIDKLFPQYTTMKSLHIIMFHVENTTLYTLHSTLYTLHPTHYTLQ